MNIQDESIPSPAYSPTKRELIMISSYQKKLQDQKNKHYKTIEYVRNCVPLPSDPPAYQNQTNIINMELDEDLIT